MAEDYLLEQYKLTFDAFNRETQRFWFRFNVLLGFEFAGLIGILVKIDVLALNLLLLKAALVFMLVYSVATFAIVLRGIRVYLIFIEVIEWFEVREPRGRLHVIGLFKSKSKGRIFKREWKIFSGPWSMYIAAGIAGWLVLMWIAFICWSVLCELELPASTINRVLKIVVGDVRGSY